MSRAGKSTLLARISAATPRIADYPFTTLAPQLGIVELDGERRFVAADIPGIIEGAHEGVGLGLEFLRHIERTRVLLHLVDVYDRSDDEIAQDFHTIREELRSYSLELVSRPIITVLTKSDLLPAGELDGLRQRVQSFAGECQVISAATGSSIAPLLEAAWREVVS